MTKPHLALKLPVSPQSGGLQCLRALHIGTGPITGLVAFVACRSARTWKVTAQVPAFTGRDSPVKAASSTYREAPDVRCVRCEAFRHPRSVTWWPQHLPVWNGPQEGLESLTYKNMTELLQNQRTSGQTGGEFHTSHDRCHETGTSAYTGSSEPTAYSFRSPPPGSQPPDARVILPKRRKKHNGPLDPARQGEAFDRRFGFRCLVDLAGDRTR